MAAIKLFHVEDYKIMREGIKQLISLDSDIENVGECRNGEELLDTLDNTDVDVLILDIYLDAMEDLNTLNGFQLCRLVLERYPHIKIVAHSIYDDADRVAAIFKAGALGFVSKKSGFKELLRAIKTVITGEKFYLPRNSRKTEKRESIFTWDGTQFKK